LIPILSLVTLVLFRQHTVGNGTLPSNTYTALP